MTEDTRPAIRVERVQLGVRLEKRMVKVLKALAEHGDMTLTALLEDVILHAFEGVSTFSLPETQELVATLKRVYGMDYDVHSTFREGDGEAEAAKA